jgi:hypothetical protein
MNTTQAPSTGAKIVGLLFCGIAAVGIIGVLATSDTSSSPAPVENACKSDWHACKDNGDLINNYFRMYKAHVACKMAAEKVAKYGDPKFPSLYFRSYRVGDDVKNGKAILVEPDARYQNAFGAMVHSEVTCFYDLASDQVDNIEVRAN